MDKQLPKDFRKLTIRERRRILAELFSLTPAELHSSGCEGELLDMADVMVESAAGFVPIPMGIAGGFLIDGIERSIPMATEEPSVIAAATYGAKILGRAGGIQTAIDEPVMTAQVFLEGVPTNHIQELCGSARDPESPAVPGGKTASAGLKDLHSLLHREIARILPAMTARGGGYRDCDVVYLPDSRLLRIQIHIDVRDAMGANILNTAAEGIKPLLQKRYGGRSFMAILTNDSGFRLARAGFRMPLTVLRRRGIDSKVLAERIVRASALAQEDPSRAVTHNKGIMNGITALALATGNDTRGLEAAVHRFASKHGRYRGLTQYRIDQDHLIGRIELPVPLGSVGGAIGFHPVARMALRILKVSSAGELGRIAAALGLVQNFSAISALVAEGIQHGHMRFHALRLAYQAGARDVEIAPVAASVSEEGVFNLKSAHSQLQRFRRTSSAGADTAAGGTESGYGAGSQ